MGVDGLTSTTNDDPPTTLDARSSSPHQGNVRTIPPGSTLAIDGNGITFHLPSLSTIPRRCSLVLLACVGIITCVADELSDTVVAWVQSKPGGYCSDKLEIRRLDPNDDTSPLGVFARDSIQAGETLMRIPHECYISVWNEAKNMDVDDMEDAAEAHYYNLCLLAQKTKREMQRQDQSEFGPYVRYLNNQSKGQIPATWSDEGKELLRNLFPQGSDVVDWMRKEKENGCFSSMDSFGEHVFALTRQRAFDIALIPLLDMINHDNGRINVDNTPMLDGEGIRVWALREIQSGEEIYQSYDKCKDCMGVDDYWGTPEILRDFGFVERYPHRFVYTNRDIWFEVLESEDGGEKEVRWDDHEIDGNYDSTDYYGSPGRSGIEFLRQELERIDSLPPYEEKCHSDVPPNECAIITQYKKAVIEAFPLAIHSARSRLPSDFHSEEEL